MKTLRPQRAKKFAAKFCENGFNASKAVRQLGITTNPKSAWVIGHRLLSNVVTIKAVEDHLKASKMSADEVLERLSDIARKTADFRGSDIVKANELIGKGHGIFIDKVESSSTVTTIDPSQLLRSINKLASKTGANPRDIALEFKRDFSDQDDPDYNPDLEAAIVQIVANMPVSEQISESTLEQ